MLDKTLASRKRASIRQVAQHAGVSPMTVSNVVRNRTGQMAEETHRRVLQAIHDLDYIPVRTSAQNKHVKTNAIGVVFLQEMTGAVGYPTFQGLCERAKQTDQDLTILLRSEPDWVKPGSESQFLDRRCDGFIFVGENRRELSESLIQHGIPIVECYSVAPTPGVARILSDNISAIRHCVEHLVSLGHTRIAHLGGPINFLEADQRLTGFQYAMRDLLGVTDAPVVRGTTWGDLWGFGAGDPGVDTRPLAEAVLALDVTAVVCANDLYALALWRMAEEKGVRVPQDLSITGVDNIVQGAHRGLTSISQPFEQIGHAAVNAVLNLQKGADSEEVSRILPVTLVKRASTAPPSISV